MQSLKLDDLISDSNQVQFKTLRFNGGEQHITIAPYGDRSEITIEISLTSSDKIMLLFLATNALRLRGYSKINLFAPYIPYGRQDRVCNPGEPLSIKVMAAMINAQNYHKVWTLDNHSEVANALLNHQREVDLARIVMRMRSENSVEKEKDFKRYALVSPDAGALKKTYKLSMAMGGIPVIECSKQRDVATGQILHTNVRAENIDRFEKLLIVDDICDGGRTFIELAKLLQRAGAPHIELFVSHGIFSQGFVVFQGLIEKIYTTKSFINDAPIFRESFLTSDLL